MLNNLSSNRTVPRRTLTLDSTLSQRCSMILILTLYSSQADTVEFQWQIFYLCTIPVTMPASLCCGSWECYCTVTRIISELKLLHLCSIHNTFLLSMGHVPRHDLLLPSCFFQLILNTSVAKTGKQLSPTTLYSQNSSTLCAP